MSIFNTKDKLEYFKNNVQAEDQNDFDPSQYYYNRDSNAQSDSLQQHNQLHSSGYSLDNYGGQRQQLSAQQQSLRVGSQQGVSSLVQDNYLNAGRSGYNGQGLNGISLSNSSSNINGVYGSSNRIGELNGAPLNSSNLSSRVISANHSGSSNQQFDSSSFPSLSSIGNNSSVLVGGASRGYSAVAQLGVSTPLSRSDPDFGSEDFPALPGSSLLINSKISDQVVGSAENKLIGSQNGSNSLNQGGNTMFSGSGSMLGGEAGGDSQSQSGSHPLLGSITASQQSSAVQVPMTKEQRFGLAGLLEVIRFTDKDVNTLALGADLTTFGLNLNSSDSLFPSFGSPFTDSTQAPDPQFNTPACYMMHPPSLKSEHLSKFQLETLFYMFYAMPKDILQACASQELYRRDWRYHGELRLWLKPRSSQELMLSHPNVQFAFFDSSSWETRLFTTPHRNLVAGMLSEEEVRVKVPQPNSIPLGGQQGSL